MGGCFGQKADFSEFSAQHLDVEITYPADSAQKGAVTAQHEEAGQIPGGRNLVIGR